MKKLISCIMAVSVIMTTMLFGTVPVYAAECDNAVAGVDIWNHEFKNAISDDVISAIDEIGDTDTIAISVFLFDYTFDEIEYNNINEFAEKNGRLDEIVVNDDGTVDVSEELQTDYIKYVFDVMSKLTQIKREKINKEYSVSEIDYFGSIFMLYCVATKEQVIKLADADFAVTIELADKTYYTFFNSESTTTWDEYHKIEKETREYINQNMNMECPEDKYDVLFSNDITDLPVLLIQNINYPSNCKNKIYRKDSIVWLGTDSPEGNIYFYVNGKVQNIAELYISGSIDTETMYRFNGRFYGDIDGDMTINVNDVTEMQMILSGSLEDEYSIYYEVEELFCDINEDGKVDVQDVTALQSYISMTISGMPS